MRNLRHRDVQDPSKSQVIPFGIQHPEYRYLDSRNPYWNKIREAQGFVLSNNETELHQGRWRSLFVAPGRQLHVEIGCNAGHVLVEWAARCPEDRYIGIDWKFKAIFRGFEKAQKKKLTNVAFLRAHAERIQYMFAPTEIDHLYLFFPDPWAKKSQWKNRYITAESLRVLAGLVKPGGGFHIKTDHPGYFKWMEDAVAKVPESWEVVSRTEDLHLGHPDPRSLDLPEVTIFEKLFIKDGLAINEMRLRRVGR